MKTDGFKNTIEEMLASAGVTINGNNPWDIRVHEDRFYCRILSEASLGLGESYMDGWWDCDALDEFINKILKAKLDEKVKANWKFIFWGLNAKLFNLQSRSGSKKVITQHYDLSTNLYMSFLDNYNQYTCGYFKDTEDLNTAQGKKLDLICKKLNIKSTDKVLDIGCGWGGFAKYAAEHYGCHVTGITISDEQIKYAKNYTRGLPVEIIKKDYRDLDSVFDKILVCGMIEHVGYKNYRVFMNIVNHCLTDEGLFLLHTIGENKSVTYNDIWTDKYIFPGGMLPSISQIGKAMEDLFVMEDWHNFGPDYDKTLMAWYQNFDNSWPKIKSNYDERFYRMWKYYLLSFAGSFRARHIQLWQIVMTKPGTRQPNSRIS